MSLYPVNGVEGDVVVARVIRKVKLVTPPTVLEGAGACLVWQGSCSDRGNPLTRIAGKRFRVRRAMYIAHFGPIADEAVLVSRCGVTRCVNPAHLYVGTAADAAKERGARGRNRSPFEGRTTCRRGHPFDDTNTGRTKDGRRFCLTCNREAVKRFEARKRRGVSKPMMLLEAQDVTTVIEYMLETSAHSRQTPPTIVDALVALERLAKEAHDVLEDAERDDSTPRPKIHPRQVTEALAQQRRSLYARTGDATEAAG